MLPPELVQYYDLEQLLYGDFAGRLRWVIRLGAEWYAGPLLGELFDAAADRLLVVTEVADPGWA